MYKMQNLLPFLFIALIPLSSCKTTDCFKGFFSFNLIGFSDAEADKIVVKRYPKGQGFQTARDSTILEKSFTRSNDTLNMANSTGMFFVADFDYELLLSQNAPVIRITDLIEEKKEIKHPFFSNVKVGCENPISVCKINGQPTSLVHFNNLYIRK